MKKFVITLLCLFSLFGTMNISNVYALDSRKEIIEEISPKLLKEQLSKIIQLIPFHKQ